MVYGVGYSSNQKNSYSNPNNKCFLTWRNMLKRCYSSEEKYKNYREQGVSVCEEWFDFDVFEKWFYRNYYSVNNEVIHLDKDILKHGNKIYCPEFCVFVPQRLNSLFVRNANKRGDLPIGVYKGGKGIYISSCSVNGFNVRDEHADPISAFEKYKQIKEVHVKELAMEYREDIPETLYNAMMMFRVEITD